MAAFGRTSAVKAINRAGAAIAKLQQDWNAHLQSVAQGQETHSTADLMNESVKLAQGLAIVHQHIMDINHRIGALKAREIDVEAYSEEAMYQRLLNSRRSSETIEWRLKRALPVLAQDFDQLKGDLALLEQTFSAKLSGLADIHNLMCTLEQSAAFRQTTDLDEQLDRDINIDEADLVRISLSEQVHEMREQREAQQDEVIFSLLCSIASTGVKIARQTQIVEFFKPVGGG